MPCQQNVLLCPPASPEAPRRSTRPGYRRATDILMADSAPRIDRSCIRYTSDLSGLSRPDARLYVVNERRHPIPGSGHHGDRPSSRLNQPPRQRTGRPVTGAGGRPHHHGIGTDALSYPAQLSEWVPAGGDEGDGNAQVLEDLLNLAARFLSRLPGEPLRGSAAICRRPHRQPGNENSGHPGPLPARQASRIPASPRRGRRSIDADENRPGAVGSQFGRGVFIPTAQQERRNQAAQPPRQRRCLTG